MRKKIVLFLITICCLVVSADAASKKFTLVIDAGHGGHDTGAVGAISKEKNLTLKFALAFGRLVERNCPDVRVIYTRKTDVFVELYKRAEVANRNKADLFISIHINALPRGRVARGFQTYTLGSSKRTGKKTGVTQNTSDIVGYMDIDLSTDINTLGRAIELLEQDPGLKYINGTRFSKGSKTIGRKWYRKITSAGLVFILRRSLKMK